ncbi:Uncharacterised protein [Segatella copri]|nr:Uncharacterised protein [Segatella copri]
MQKYNFMLKQQKIFFDFLRFCIGSAKEIPGSLKEMDWKELYAIAKKQCLVGVLFDGIKKLPAEHVGMKKELLLQWMAESQMLEKANVRLNDAAIQVSEWFRKKGLLISGWKGEINELSPLYALSRLMKRRAITTSSSHRIRVWRWKCIIDLAFCCASGITENFRNIMRG